ncbi:hypothetical protein D9757_004100 [Collybiopsis confluens]|uniref:Uncharacterized protein n=1 Tax=Collybiopsis confluens TaxID=2823264 RepID=A0A8H5HUA5_9AGAR|nr:hypothetical protein D9757_004100 [Collybiopsis confluens]
MVLPTVVTLLYIILSFSVTSAWFDERARPPSFLDSVSLTQRDLFDYGMTGLDINWGGPGTFIFGSARYSAWYAVGLLARNTNEDVKNANELLHDVETEFDTESCYIEFLIKLFTDPSKIWFGTFKDAPDSPDPGDTWTPEIYSSYDPNQGLFVGTSFIIILEEFAELLDPSIKDLVKESLYNATVGDGYRNGGINGDNLYPVYSNPWFMRIMAATYAGNLMKDTNMSFWGDEWAREGIAAFDVYTTLPEYNCGTYNGVVLYALALWGYMPQNSTIVTRAADLISKIWIDLAQYYNPTLGSLGPPWDRAYGYDMRNYFGILGVQITGLIGGIANKTAPLPVPLVGSLHYGDAAIIPLLPIISKFHDPYVPKSVISQLKVLEEGQHFFAQAVSPPFDNVLYPRNYTSWKEPGLSVGGIEVDNQLVGGAAINPSVYVPASIMWRTPLGETAWINHYPTSSVISAIASSNSLAVSYPPSRAFTSNNTFSSTMSFLFSGHKHLTLHDDFLKSGSAELPGLKLNVSGSLVGQKSTLRYIPDSIDGLSFYNLTYFIPQNFTEIPSVTLSFAKA